MFYLKSLYNPKKTKLYIGIMVSLLLSFSSVYFFAERIFLAGTPQLNPSMIAAFQSSPFQGMKYIVSLEGSPSVGLVNDIVETAKVPRVKAREGLSYVQIAKGVQAAENPDGQGRFVKIEQGTKFEIQTVRLSDGREMRVYIPME